MLRGECYRGVERIRDSKVSVLCKDNKTLGFLCDCLGHEARVIIEAIHVSFVSGVEEDWASLWVPVVILDQIAHGELFRLAAVVEMIDIDIEKVLLDVVVPVFEFWGSLRSWVHESARAKLAKGQRPNSE